MNSYKKNLLRLADQARGTREILAKKTAYLNSLTRQLAVERRKYRQGRLNLFYVITTENSISAAKTDIFNLKYQLITYYIDYLDATTGELSRRSWPVSGVGPAGAGRGLKISHTENSQEDTAKLAIKRPIFISSIVAIIVILGGISYKNIGLELIPNVTFPIISVTTTYAGASPSEMESLVSKPLEDELGTIAGIKHINSENTEGYSIITMEFNMDVDVEKVAQDVRDKVNVAKNSLPTDLEEDPLVQKYDPDSSPVLKLALLSDLPPAKIYDLAKEKIKPQLGRIKDVGNIDITGGNRREIQVEIDQNRMNDYRMSMITLVNQMKNSGSNVSIGRRSMANRPFSAPWETTPASDRSAALCFPFPETWAIQSA